MELTAEQKFLMALIKFHMSETAGTETEQKAFKDACKEYLDQFREVTEKVDQSVDVNEKVEFQGCDCSMPDPITGEMPIEKFRVGSELDVCPYGCTGYGACENEYCNDWIPEEGSICWFKGEVFEYAGNIINNVTMKPFEARYIKDNGCVTEIYYDEFIKSARPIAELEGLKEGDKVWFTSEHAWVINEVQNNGYRVNNDYYQGRYSKSRGGQYLCIDLGGYCTTIGIRAFRTADRAERFGRG